jgi:hypothetical protein
MTCFAKVTVDKKRTSPKENSADKKISGILESR